MNLSKLSAGWIVLLVLLIQVCTSPAQAEPPDPDQIIRESTELVLKTVEEQKKLHGKKVTKEMIDVLIEVLEPVVDFPAIAKAVMGKHAGKASRQQQQQFTLVFRHALLNLYLKSFLTFEIDDIIVHELDPDFKPGSGRATVRMTATGTDGVKYALSYSMRADERGAWMVRNFIVEGINIGLTFLNQFDGAMARHGNDIKKVIDNWSAEMVAS